VVVRTDPAAGQRALPTAAADLEEDLEVDPTAGLAAVLEAHSTVEAVAAIAAEEGHPEAGHIDYVLLASSAVVPEVLPIAAVVDRTAAAHPEAGHRSHRSSAVGCMPCVVQMCLVCDWWDEELNLAILDGANQISMQRKGIRKCGLK
jgi:hypothetical protein